MRVDRLWPALFALLLVLAGCRAGAQPLPTPSPAPTATPTSLPPTATPRPSVPATATPSPTPAGPLVMLDAGHGGEDWGSYHLNAQGTLTLTEKEANLAIVLYTRDALAARGVRVALMRDGDVALNAATEDVNEDGEVNSRDEVQRRVDIANEAGAGLLLSIHQNAYIDGQGTTDPSVGGTVTYYCSDRPFSEDNLRFAELVQEYSMAALHELGYDSLDRGVREDSELSEWGTVQHLVVLGPVTDRIVRAAEMPGALTESLFMSHDGEAALLADDAVRRRLGEAYADAIVAFLAEADLGDASRPTPSPSATVARP